MQQADSREAKRAAILNAADGVFKNRRFDEVKLDEIAAAAGVGKGTLYLYFTNKEDLFAQMAVEGLDEMAGRIREITAMPTPYKERLFMFGREFAEFNGRRHGVMQAMNQMQSDAVNKVFRKHLSRVIDAIHELLQTGISEGVLRNDFKTSELRCALAGPILLSVRRAARVGEVINLEALLKFFWAGAAVQKQ